MRYSLTLRRVAPYLDGDVLRQLAALERMDGEVHGTENVDLGAAVYWHGAEWHGGQRSDLYRAMCATEYRPGAGEHGVDPANPYAAVLAEGGDR